MSLLQYFVMVKVVPTPKKIGIEEKRVAEVLEQQQLGQSTHKRKATVHSEEAWPKIRKYTSINGTASARRHFENELEDLPQSTVRKYKLLSKWRFLCVLKVTILVTSLPFYRRREDNHLHWEKASCPINTCVSLYLSYINYVYDY